MQVRYVRLLVALALLIAAFPSRTLSAQGDACSVVTRADVGIAVGRGAVTPGKLRRYAGDPTSECQYDTDAGNVVVTFDPTNENQFFSRWQAGYASSLQTVPGIGDAALYYRQLGTLLLRRGRSVLILNLDTPEKARGHAILLALGRRVTPRLH